MAKKYPVCDAEVHPLGRLVIAILRVVEYATRGGKAPRGYTGPLSEGAGRLHAREVAEANARMEQEAALARNLRVASVSRQIREAQGQIDVHLPVLRTKRRQLRRTDEYGVTDETEWHDHCVHFARHVIMPNLSEPPMWVALESIFDWMDARLELADEADPSSALNVETLSGVEFEHYCADELRSTGWAATVTKASGDQGVDIIATRGGAKVVIQCKRYAKPVGNKAVQEAIAACAFEDGTHAVVVSTASFTTSARTLASKTGVILIGHLELSTLADRLAPRGASAESLRVAWADVGGIPLAKRLRAISRTDRQRQFAELFGNEAFSADGRGANRGLPAGGALDPLFREAAELCIQNQSGSTSLLQRRLGIGFGRSARLIDQLADAGVLDPKSGPKGREVRVGLDDLDRICGVRE